MNSTHPKASLKILYSNYHASYLNSEIKLNFLSNLKLPN